MVLPLCSRALLAVGVLALCSLAASPAHADEAAPPTAHVRFRNGVDAVQRGELARAAVEFEAAYALNPKPVVLYNLGQTQSALGRPVEAVRSLRLYLESEPSVGLERVREIEALIQTNEQRIGVLALEVTPSDATLEVDAAPATLADGRLRLAAGRHVIVARLAGYAPGVLTVEVSGASEARERLELEPLTRAAPTESPKKPVALVNASGPDEVKRAPAEPAQSSLRPASVVALGAAGLGVAALSVGAAFALSAVDLAGAARTNGHCDAQGCDDVGFPLREAAHRRGDLATGFIIAGAVLVAGGITLHVTLGARPERSRSRVRVSFGFPGGASLRPSRMGAGQ